MGFPIFRVNKIKYNSPFSLPAVNSGAYRQPYRRSHKRMRYTADIIIAHFAVIATIICRRQSLSSESDVADVSSDSNIETIVNLSQNPSTSGFCHNHRQNRKSTYRSFYFVLYLPRIQKHLLQLYYSIHVKRHHDTVGCRHKISEIPASL